jgi:hypothetical protein
MHIKQVKEQIKNIIDDLKKNEPDLQMRLAFVGCDRRLLCHRMPSFAHVG